MLALLVALASPFAHAFGGGGSCAEDLLGAPEREIVTLVREGAVGKTPLPENHADALAPEMRVIETLREDLAHPHEAVTARDYARFLTREQGAKFLFVANYKRRSVPVLDGVLLRADDVPLANISLKYASFHHQKNNLWRLLESLRNRLELSRDFEILQNPLSWFRAVTTRQNEFGRMIIDKHFPAEVTHVNELSKLFGLFQGGPGRELRTVVDMRASGYDFAYCANPENFAAINDMVGEVKATGATLTLIWDDRHALDFRGAEHVALPVEREFGFRPKVNFEPTAMTLTSRELNPEVMASARFAFKGRDTLIIESFMIRAEKYGNRGLEQFMIDELLRRHPHITQVRR